MSSSPLPLRPRLTDHVVVRRHRAAAEDLWVVTDERSGASFALGAREWGILAQIDGTRDPEGIVLAAVRAGVPVRAGAVHEFLASLAGMGLLEAGAAEPRPPAPAPPRALERPLDPLPGFALTCDGRGSCCRLYGSIIFRPVEEARARALLPLVLDAGDRPEDAFTPLRGAVPCGASSVGLVDGRCAYLEGDGRCGLHAVAGPLAKPLGCRTFPASFVDDGEAVRVAPVVECACVLASAREPGLGEPLLPPGARTVADLDAGIVIDVLPETIPITPHRAASRADLVRWSRVVAASPPPANPALALWTLATTIEIAGLEPDAAAHALASPGAPDPESMRPLVDALLARATRRARLDETWRAPTDLARRAVRWIRDAARCIVADQDALPALLVATLDAAPSEAFYLRAAAHGHHLIDADLPLAHALRDRAVRMILARALPLLEGSGDMTDEPALREPLALVEATLRAHGLAAYAHDVLGPSLDDGAGQTSPAR
jgi:lysine-N-methylase